MQTREESDERRVRSLTDELLRAFPPTQIDPVSFLGEQFDRGLAWVHFPKGHGGLEVSAGLQHVVNEQVFAAGGPDSVARNPLGHGMCGPAIVAWGGEDHRTRYLRPLYTGEEIWCQLFSEPGSGSDLAGLAARGVRDGDEWVINGQKVWTTMAHLARWGLLIVRTDPEALKHAGLTAFVVDMHAPGVVVRPLRQMTGDAEFNEVYFTDARVSDRQRLGRVGDGWRVSLTTLMNERVSIGGSSPPGGSGPIAELVSAFKNLEPARRDVARDIVTRLWVRAEVVRLTNLRLGQARTTSDPGPEGSIGKVASAELHKDIWNCTMNLLGADAMLYGSYEMIRPETTMGYDTVPKAFLRSRANSIEGGTTEIMHNILAERVLGLPGDVRVDRDVPWNRIPRN